MNLHINLVKLSISEENFHYFSVTNRKTTNPLNSLFFKYRWNLIVCRFSQKDEFNNGNAIV